MAFRGRALVAVPFGRFVRQTASGELVVCRPGDGPLGISQRDMLLPPDGRDGVAGGEPLVVAEPGDGAVLAVLSDVQSGDRLTVGEGGHGVLAQPGSMGWAEARGGARAGGAVSVMLRDPATIREEPRLDRVAVQGPYTRNPYTRR